MSEELSDHDLKCTCYRVRKAARALTNLYDRALEPSGITVTQLSVLTELARSPHINITELGRRLGMDRTTMSRTVRPLMKDGFIGEKTGQDKRAHLLQLTKLGQETLTRATGAWRRVETEMMRNLGNGQRDLLFGLLGDAAKAANDAENRLAS